MSENAKRLLSLLVAMALLISVMPVSIHAQASDAVTAVPEVIPEATPGVLPAVPEEAGTDAEQTQTGATVLELDVAADAVITEEQNEALFSFTPTESGRHTFSATSEQDTVGELLDGDMEYLDSNDDGGIGNNFMITWNLTAGQTYYLKARYYGYNGTGTFQVQVVRTPLQSLAFTPVSVMEGTHGYINHAYNEETSQWDIPWWCYDPEYLLENSTYTATFFDGNVVTGSGASFLYNDEEYYFELDTNQTYENQWTVGNTYAITVSVCGLEVQVPVTITPSPLQSLTFTPVSVIAGTNGGMYGAYNPETGNYDLLYWSYEIYDLMQQSTYTATFTDGSVLSGHGNGFEYDGQWYDFSYRNPQSYENQWTAGNTYNIEISVLSKTVQLPITVAESPLQSITFTPISVMEHTTGGMNGAYNEETGEYDLYYWYYNENDLLHKSTYTATFADGTVIEGSETGFTYDDTWYDFQIWSSQGYDTAWTAGNTYSLTVSVMGQQVEVPVTVTASPLESLTFTPISVMEGTNGGLGSTYNPETGEYDLLYWVYDAFALLRKSTYTATFADGTVLTGDGSDNGFTYDDEWYAFSYNTDQSYANQWTAGGTYTLDVSALGKTAHVPVTITQTALESLTFTPVSVTENTEGYEESYYNPETGEYDLYYWHYYLSNLLRKSTYTATFSDGTVLTDSSTGITYDDVWYEFECTANQDRENQWTVGNTYTIDVSILGKTAQVQVTIAAQPLQSLTFTPVSVIEGTHGSIWSQGSNEEYVSYYGYNTGELLAESTYTATFADGTVLTGNGSDGGLMYDGVWYDFSGSSGQSYDNQWTAGNTYTLNVSVMGKVAQVPVTILQTPLESLIFTPVSVMKNTAGYEADWYNPETDAYDLYYWYYYVDDLLEKSTYTATFADGTVLTGNGNNGGFTYEGVWYSFECSTNQSYENPWTVGNTYSVNVTVLGKTVQMPVTVKDTPLQSITFTPISVIEGTHGSMWGQSIPDSDGYWEYWGYNIWDLMQESTYTATFADGTVLTGNGNEGGFNYDGEWYSFECSTDQSYENQWIVGNTYTLKVSVMGKTAQVPVTITEIPLQSITFTPVSVEERTNGYDNGGYWHYNDWQMLQKSTYTATFADGTVLTGNGNDDGFNYNGEWYSFHTSNDQSYENPWTVGNTYSINLTVMGKTAQVPVTITASPLESLIFTPISVMEGTHGSLWSQHNVAEGVWLRYWGYNAQDLLEESTYTATFTDGTVLTGSGNEGGFNYNGTWYSFVCSTNQTYENQWTAGNTYTLDVSVLGKSAQIPVTITQSILQSLVFTPVVVTENTNGYDNGGYWHYNDWQLQQKSTYTATFADGTVLTGNGGGLYYNGTWYSFQYYATNQSAENPWTVGNTYGITVSMLGKIVQIPVTIQESPIASVTFDPVLITEHTLGDWNWMYGSQYFRYYWWNNLTYTVTFKDGTTQKGNYSSNIEYNGEQYRVNDFSDNQSGDTPWLGGNTYTATANFGEKAYTVYVTVAISTEENGYQYIEQDGKAIITGCTMQTEILQIPETIDGYPVVGIIGLGDALAYALEIRIPDSVTMLSANALSTDYASWRWMPLKKLYLGGGISSFDANMLSAAVNLEQIDVATDNPYLCSVDGVLYDKAVTTLLVFPTAKKELHVIPDSVTDISIFFSSGPAELFANANIQLGTGTPEYKMVDGVVYNADMTKVLFCTASATGRYVMPDTVLDIAEYAFKNSNLTEVVISPNVTNIVYSAFYFCDQLKEITIPESVTTISMNAFIGCESLEKVHIEDLAAWCGINFSDNPLYYAHDLYLNDELITDLVIPDTVTNVVYGSPYIGVSDYAFYNASISSVTVPKELKWIGYDAFAGCENLEKVNISDLSAWCKIDFYNENANPLYCAHDLYLNGELITDLVIPGNYVGAYAFYNGSMTSLTVPSTVYTIDYAAFFNSAVEQITFEEGITSIAPCAFERSAVKSVDLPDSLTYLGSRMFCDCTALESVTIGKGLTSVPYRTFYNTGLKTVTLPEQVQYVEEYAFADSQLTEVVFECDEVYIFTNAFANCPLGDLEFGDNVKSMGENAFANTKATQIKLPESITEISYRVFAFNENLVSITIPDSVTQIDYFAFEGDDNLRHVLYTGTLEQWEAINAYSEQLMNATIHYEAVGDEVTTEQTCTAVRYYCSICQAWETVQKRTADHNFVDGVCTVCGDEGFWEFEIDEGTGTVTITRYVGTDTDVIVPEKIDGMTVTAIADDVFAYNRKLTSVTLPDTVTEIPAGAFAECISLQKVILGSNVSFIGDYAFSDCGQLVAVNLPDTLIIIGEGAFYNCWKLDVTIPVNVCIIGQMAFCNTGLTKLVIPEGVTDIGMETFASCHIQELTICENVKFIDSYAFAGSSIEKLTIAGCVEIMTDAFAACERLKTIVFQGDLPIMEDAFGDVDAVAFYPADNETWEGIIPYLEDTTHITWYGCTEPQVLKQPQNATVDAGEIATVTTEGHGHRLSYQWYYAAPGSDSFAPIGGDSLELTMVMDSENTGSRVYCVVTDVLGRAVQTDTVTLSTKNHNYVGEVTAPTCTEQGYTTYTCSICGDSYVGDYVDSLGHNYGVEITYPTCTEEGLVTCTCTACGHSFTTETPALGHKHKAVVTAPTCTESGYTTYTCVCGDSYTADQVPELSHSEEAVVTAPTCTEKGYTTYTCTTCGNSRREDYTTVAGHSYSTETTLPTCTEDGQIICTCTTCGNSFTVTTPAVGHTHGKQTDCTVAVNCSVCGIEIYPAKTHAYDNVLDTECNDCGTVNGNAPVLDKNLNILKHTVNLKSSLKLGFRLEAKSLVGAADYYVVFHKAEGRTEQNKTIILTKEDIGAPEANGYYYAEYPTIPVCEMGVKIEATLYVVDTDGTVRRGETDSYSVEDYLYLLLESYIPYAKYTDSIYYKSVQVAVELLNFGAEAQKEFNYKEDQLVNARLTSKELAFRLAEDPNPVNNRNWGANNGEVKFESSTLDLKEKIYNQVRINVAGLKTGAKEDLKMVVKNQETGEIVQTIYFDEFTTAGTNKYYVPVTEIKPANMTVIYTLQLFAGDTAVSSVATYSVESYVRLAVNAGISAATVSMAALRYGTAVAKLG